MNRHRLHKPPKYLPGDHPWRSATKNLSCVVCVLAIPLLVATQGTATVRSDTTEAAAPAAPLQRQTVSPSSPYVGSPLIWSPRHPAAIEPAAMVDPLPTTTRNHAPLPSSNERVNRVEHLHSYRNDSAEVHRSSEEPSRHHQRTSGEHDHAERRDHKEDRASGRRGDRDNHSESQHGGVRQHDGHDHGGHDHGGGDHGGHGSHGGGGGHGGHH